MSQTHSRSHGFTDFMHGVGEDYNLKLPPLFRHLALAGTAGVVIGVVLWHVLPASQGVALVALILGLVHLLPAAVVWLIINRLQASRFGIRERIIRSVPWRGDEQVLDVGTGSGIMLFGCAKQLSSGKAVGIDIWLPNAGGGTEEKFWNNARAEGLADRVELRNMDARHMAFEDNSFDMIVSSFALHHIGHGAADREQALVEMLRVLKPGGTIALCDVAQVISPTAEFLQRSGISVQRHGRIFVTIMGRRN